MADQYDRDCASKLDWCSSEVGGGENENRDVQICALSAQNHASLLLSLVEQQNFQNPFHLSYSKHSTLRIGGTAEEEGSIRKEGNEPLACAVPASE